MPALINTQSDWGRGKPGDTVSTQAVMRHLHLSVGVLVHWWEGRTGFFCLLPQVYDVCVCVWRGGLMAAQLDKGEGERGRRADAGNKRSTGKEQIKEMKEMNGLRKTARLFKLLTKAWAKPFASKTVSSFFIIQRPESQIGKTAYVTKNVNSDSIGQHQALTNVFKLCCLWSKVGEIFSEMYLLCKIHLQQLWLSVHPKKLSDSLVKYLA